MGDIGSVQDGQSQKCLPQNVPQHGFPMGLCPHGPPPLAGLQQLWSTFTTHHTSAEFEGYVEI